MKIFIFVLSLFLLCSCYNPYDGIKLDNYERHDRFDLHVDAYKNIEGTTYLWNTGETTSLITHSEAGKYWVDIVVPTINHVVHVEAKVASTEYSGYYIPNDNDD
jgi:hypothetical protein